MARKPITDVSAWPSLSLEGNLVAPAMVASIDRRQASEQTEEDYRIRKGLTIRVEISTAFRVGQSHFDGFGLGQFKGFVHLGEIERVVIHLGRIGSEVRGEIGQFERFVQICEVGQLEWLVIVVFVDIRLGGISAKGGFRPV